MKAVITWSGGKTEIEDAEPGDPRVAQELDRLAKVGVDAPISLEFQDDFV
jgi:hypothetical protein